MSKTTKPFEVRIAFPLDDDFDGVTKNVITLIGRECDWSGCGATWAGCGMRDMGWACDTFAEAQRVGHAVKAAHPDWPVNVREAVSHTGGSNE